MVHINLILSIITYLHIHICIVYSDPSIEVSTSVVKYPWRMRGTVQGYSSTHNKLRVLGGVRVFDDGARGLLRVLSINVINDSILYDEDTAPPGVNATSTNIEWSQLSVTPNVIADGDSSAMSITDKWSCERQCATQVDNLIYILNPVIVTDEGNDLGPTQLMLVFDVDTQQYIDQSNYGYNVPNAVDYVTNDPGCVVSDGSMIFILGSIQSDHPSVSGITCPPNISVCPLTELYGYDINTKIWTTSLVFCTVHVLLLKSCNFVTCFIICIDSNLYISMI